MFRYLTAGESHGENLVGIIEGFPANFKIDIDYINNQLKSRQSGYGRSERMQIERDKINIFSGLNENITTGNPISFQIKNKGISVSLKEVTKPRPGHADLVGYLKYNQSGGRNILERASARETASRVAIGSICRQFLEMFDVKIYSHVNRIGSIKSDLDYYNGLNKIDLYNMDNDLKVIDENSRNYMREEIKNAMENGDSLGGDIEIIIENTPLGLGSYTNWDKKLDAKIAYSLMSIQGMKSVSIGSLKDEEKYIGSQFHDKIIYSKDGYKRSTNNSGGIEGGMSNGEDIVINVSMKPIPTLKKGMDTVDIVSKKTVKNQYERSDVSAVTAASVVCENVVAITLMEEFLKVFGGDFLEEIEDNFKRHNEYLKEK